MKKIFPIFALAALSGCHDKENKNKNEERELFPVSLTLDHEIGGEDLVLGTGVYLSPLGYEYSVNVFKYFISNIEFIRTDGDIYTVPQDSSYFLINESEPSSKNVVVNIPAGEYSSIRFLVGVDSLRNTMDISRRQGVLDPAGDALGMYWGWNSGYIHLVLEGHSEDIPVEISGAQNFVFHVGGFGGYSTPTINNIRQITVHLSDKGNLKSSNLGISSIELSADLNKILKNEMTGDHIDFTISPSFMFDRGSMILSSNYQYMFSHNSTVNK